MLILIFSIACILCLGFYLFHKQQIQLISKDLECSRLKQLLELKEKQLLDQIADSKDKLNFLVSNKSDLEQRFQALSSSLIMSNSKYIEDQAIKNIGNIVNPLSKQLDQFKHQISSCYSEEARERFALNKEILSLEKLNYKLHEQTLDLSNALKGNNKTQGIWGERVLEEILISSGLRADIEYSKQTCYTTGDGNRLQPDVIVKLPDNKSLIIDSKLSLLSYIKYSRELDKDSFKEFMDSIKAHIKNLSDKSYEQIEGIETINYVFMFIPIESAFIAIIEANPELVHEVSKKNIFLVSPNNLLINLKIISNIWTYAHQNANTKKIINHAVSLYDKFIGLVNDIDEVSKKISLANKFCESAKNKLISGNASIITQVEKLKEYGAKGKKSISSTILSNK